MTGQEKKMKKVMLLGSGALKIGEAGEFDYSGSQALSALREEGVASILLNPNIATVQTSEGAADRVYFLPVSPLFAEGVIEKERPDGVCLSFGGQTALNCGVELFTSGVFERYGVEVLGTPVSSIIDTEDRERFVRRLSEIGVKMIESAAVQGASDALEAAARLGYPVIVRAAYALGGLGSGLCANGEELLKVAAGALKHSPQILIEKSLMGWKEIEYEVVRDRYDNCIAVCNMENLDPLGIHTGESIVVAPSQTLTNSEYQTLRQISIQIARHLGIVGECNVQFALDPGSEDYRVIEVNARLSRSSALASKATGYPLAYIAMKLALGYGLHELKNSVTKSTSAFFEPALDYIVCKIPRWDLDKFGGVEHEIGTAMKSVGEVMAIGRTFEEALQKGLRMISRGMHGIAANRRLHAGDLDRALAEPTDTRIFAVGEAYDAGYSTSRIHELTKIDPWFLRGIESISKCAAEIERHGSIDAIPEELLRRAKKKGFSDFQIAKLLYADSRIATDKRGRVRARRKALGVVPVVKQIDTLAAEYPAQTGYLYLTYNGETNDVAYEDDGRSVVVLGGGPYRIGSSVEFDWCSVGALTTIRDRGYRGVIINCNPETVSTDCDICDRLYFEELSFERVMDIAELENPHGVVVSTGGQTPNNLAMPLESAGVPILGTSAADIDRAEDRHKFSSMLDDLGISQPRWKELRSPRDARLFADEVGFPVLVRPSYVLSGAAMRVCLNEAELEQFLGSAAGVSSGLPVVVSEFVTGAMEAEIDAVASRGDMIASAVSEHVEFAGTHSGDATILLPPQHLSPGTISNIRRVASEIASALAITGPFNIQFLVKDEEIKVIECNLRASRSLPFVSKVLRENFIELSARAMLGEQPEKIKRDESSLKYVGVKASQFSFARLPGSDPAHGVEMASTGEAGCFGGDADEALLKAMLSVGMRPPSRGVLLSAGGPHSKAELLGSVKLLVERGIKLYATEGTHRFLAENGISSIRAGQPSEDVHPGAVGLLGSGEADMVVNIPKNNASGELRNGYRVRRAAIDNDVPLFTNARLAGAFIRAFCRFSPEELPIRSWDEYV